MPDVLNAAGEVLPGLWVGNLMSAFHLGHLAQESTNNGSSSTERVVVTVISVLSNPNLIKLVTDALEDQRRLQGDATNINAAADRSRRINIEINHIVIHLKDTVRSDLSSLLPNALAAIDEALGKNVTISSPSTNNYLLPEFNHDDEKFHNQQRICLVHCAKGASRSVSVIVAYLLSRHSHTFNTFDEALRHLRTVRPQALPNGGFATELRGMERNLD
jgi:hypothetical protein